jgi:hypothetical protein
VTDPVAWAHWAEEHLQKLWLAKCDAETQRSIDRNSKIREIGALTEAEEKIVAVNKRQEKLQEAKEHVKRVQSKSKTYRDFCDALQRMGNQVEKAARDMDILVADKKVAKLAFEKWEKTNCQPLTNLMDFWRRVETAQDDNRREHAERMMATKEREEQISQSEARYKDAVDTFADERRRFLHEQQEWREAQSQQLNGLELNEIIETRVRNEVISLKPQMLAEANRLGHVLAKQDWEAEKTVAPTTARQEGFGAGKGEGYAEGLDHGQRAGFADGRHEAEQEN